jgi:hypothetical protein
MWVGLGEQSLGFSEFLQVAVVIFHRMYVAQGRYTSVRDASSKRRIAQGMHSQHRAGVKGKIEKKGKKSV